jgi:hypothetical protein
MEGGVIWQERDGGVVEAITMFQPNIRRIYINPEGRTLLLQAF